MISVRVLPHAAAPVADSVASHEGMRLPLFSSMETDVTLEPGNRLAIPTGLSLGMPDETEAQITTDAQIANMPGLIVLNNPGTIDPDYRGELKAIIYNVSRMAVLIRRGDKIAELRFAKFARAKIISVDELDDTTRGSDGLGSTGNS